MGAELTHPVPDRLGNLRPECERLLRELDRRDALIAEMQVLGARIDEAWAAFESGRQTPADLENCTRARQRLQTQIEDLRAQTEDIYNRCRRFRERLAHALATPALFAAAERLHALPAMNPSSLRLDMLRLHALLQEPPEPPTPKPETPVAPAAALLTAKQVASEIGLSGKTVYRLARDGRIPYVRIQGSLRFRPADVKAWLDAKTFRPRRP